MTNRAFNSVFESIHNLLWNESGSTPEEALVQLTLFFSFRFIEKRENINILQNISRECKWSYVSTIAEPELCAAEFIKGKKFLESPILPHKCPVSSKKNLPSPRPTWNHNQVLNYPQRHHHPQLPTIPLQHRKKITSNLPMFGSL